MTLHAYIINLPGSLERRKRIEQAMAMLGYPHFAFFPAVDGRKGEHPILQRYDNGLRIRKKGNPLTPGEVGVFASHFLLWQRCVELNEPILVMEDDIEPTPHFLCLLERLPSWLQQYDYLKLAGLFDTAYRELESRPPFHVVLYHKGPSGGQCYALTPRGAKALLDKAQRWGEPVDDYLDSYWLHGVPCVGILPHAVQHLDQGSDIGQRAPKTRSLLARLRREAYRLSDQIRARHAFRRHLKRLMGEGS